jgi:hypothetical protein
MATGADVGDVAAGALVAGACCAGGLLAPPEQALRNTPNRSVALRNAFRDRRTV